MAIDTRPYRPNVGICLFDRHGRVFMGRSLRSDGPERVPFNRVWQLPQGGVDPKEDVVAAARRELWEETGIERAEIIDRLSFDITYDWPLWNGGAHRLARWRGQRQTWFAFRFQGEDAEINLSPEGQAPEFGAWSWRRLWLLPEICVPYKLRTYRRIVQAFARHGLAAKA